MAKPKPLMAKSSGTDQANAAIQSALRTLDAEGSGIAAIPPRCRGRWTAFAAAVDRKETDCWERRLPDRGWTLPRAISGTDHVEDF